MPISSLIFTVTVGGVLILSLNTSPIDLPNSPTPILISRAVFDSVVEIAPPVVSTVC
jgi:hypothetical protein